MVRRHEPHDAAADDRQPSGQESRSLGLRTSEVTAPILTQWPEAAEVSIASQTACTAAPSRKPGVHGVSGQPSSRSATWFANDAPYPTPWPIGHHWAA